MYFIVGVTVKKISVTKPVLKALKLQHSKRQKNCRINSMDLFIYETQLSFMSR